jgi:hypothetical protein
MFKEIQLYNLILQCSIWTILNSHYFLKTLCLNKYYTIFIKIPYLTKTTVPFQRISSKLKKSVINVKNESADCAVSFTRCC